MRTTTWIYPWDLRGGVEATLGQLQELGVRGLSLAASYHTVTTLSPRGPKVFSCSDGGVFFPARPGRYGRIAPAVWPVDEVVNVWGEVCEQASDYDLVVDAWVIGLFQPWMAQQYPEAARVLVTGDRSNVGVCPSSPMVREYLTSLCSDLATQFPLRYIRMEGLALPEFDYGWFRPRVLTGLSPPQRKVLATCCCQNCIGAADAVGIDVNGVLRKLRGVLEGDQAAVAGHRATALDDDRAPGSAGAPDEECEAYVRLAKDAPAGVIRTIADGLLGVSNTAGVVVFAPTDAGGGEMPVTDVLGSIAGLVLLEPLDRPEVGPVVDAWRRQKPDGLVDLHFHPTTLDVVPSPDADGAAGPEALLQTAAALGVDEVSLYNYGLLSPDEFEAMVQVVARAVD